MLSACYPVIKPYDILQEWIIERGNWRTKKWKMAILEVKFELNINEVVDKNSLLWECGPCPQEILDIQSEELHEELNRFINEENGCDEKNIDVPEEVTLAKTSH